LFYYTPELYMNEAGNYLAIHFSPIIGLLFPLYHLFPSVYLLLVVKSFLLALASYPLFKIVKELTGKGEAGLLIGLAYLLHPGVQGANWFDFQPQVFTPLLVFTTYYMLIKRNWKLYFVFLTLSLTIEEHIFSILILLLLSHFLYNNLKTLKSPEINTYENRIVILSIILCGAFYFLASSFKGTYQIAPEFIELYRSHHVFSVLNFKGNTLLLPLYVLTHLRTSYLSFVYDFHLKFMHYIFIFSPLLFLPIMNRFYLLNSVLLLPFYLSNYRAYYMVGSHYPLYVLPSIFISMTYTLTRFDHAERLSKFVLVASSIMIVALSPVSPLSHRLNHEAGMLWYPEPHRPYRRVHDLHEAINIIPDEASVLVQNHVFPHVSGRTDAYVIPVTDFSPDQSGIVEGYLGSLIERSDFVLLDLKEMDRWSLETYERVNEEGSFGVSALYDDVILFQRGLNGADRAIFGSRVYHAHSDPFIMRQGIIVDDPSAVGDSAVLSPKGSDRGVFLYGPYIYMPAGTYNVSARVKALNQEEGLIGAFDVTGSQGTELVAKRYLYGYELPDQGWRAISLNVSLKLPLMLAEFRLHTEGTADLYVDCVMVNQTGPPTGLNSTRALNYRDLILEGGEPTPGGLIRSRGSKGAVSWYGPYHRLAEGCYEASYQLRALPQGSDGNDVLIVLDVCCGKGGTIPSRQEVTHGDLDPGGLSGEWCTFRTAFTVDGPGAVVEFRGLAPSDGCDVYLGQIIIEPLASR